MFQYWTDEFLQWDPAQFGGITSLHIPAELIWKPDLLVYNKFLFLVSNLCKTFSANMNIKENELLTNVEVSSSGKISLFRAIITDVTCDLQLDRFPYDQVG